MHSWNAEAARFDEDAFSGVVRLFPLPDVVLFPHVVQRLHIFEDRYRAMLDDALQSDEQIAMGLLCPGWEPNYEGRPAVAPVACLGRVVTHYRFDDGSSNVLLLGLRRVRLLRELESEKAFRQVEVELIDEIDANDSDPCAARLRSELLGAFEAHLPSACGAEQLREILAEQVPLGMLADLVAYSAPLDAASKLELLTEPSATIRARVLLDAVGRGQQIGCHSAKGAYPPIFSAN